AGGVARRRFGSRQKRARTLVCTAVDFDSARAQRLVGVGLDAVALSSSQGQDVVRLAALRAGSGACMVGATGMQQLAGRFVVARFGATDGVVVPQQLDRGAWLLVESMVVHPAGFPWWPVCDCLDVWLWLGRVPADPAVLAHSAASRAGGARWRR